jgi:hypothetical protein
LKESSSQESLDFLFFLSFSHGEVHLIQACMIKLVSDLPQVSGFLHYEKKTDHHEKTEILLKVALSTHIPNPKVY